MNSKIKKSVIPLIIGLVIFGLTLHFIGIGKIFQNLAKLNIYFYFLALGCFFMSITFWVLRWRAFIKASGHEVSLSGLYKILFVGLGLNNLTPLAKFGGEPMRAYLLKREYGIKMREGFATVIAELTIFLIGNIAVVLTSIFLITTLMRPPTWLYIVLIAFGLLVVLALFGIVGVYSGRDVIVRIINWLGNKINRLQPYRKKILQRYKEFQNTFRKCLQNKRVFAEALVYTSLDRVFAFLRFFILFLALGHFVSPVKIVIAMGISSILLSLPSTPGSLGVYEGGFVSALVLLGIEAGAAGVVVFLDRLVWFWGITAIGGLIAVYYGISLLDSAEREEMKEDLKG